MYYDDQLIEKGLGGPKKEEIEWVVSFLFKTHIYLHATQSVS